MNAKDFLEEIAYYNTNVDGELYEELGIETLADILELYHQRKVNNIQVGQPIFPPNEVETEGKFRKPKTRLRNK